MDEGAPFFAWVHLYDAGVHGVDRHVGALIAGLEAQGLLEDTLVVVTADHGEELFDHGAYPYHGAAIHGSTLRVPPVLRHPASFAAGTRETSPASLMDLVPTICQLFDLPAPGELFALRRGRWRLAWNPQELRIRKPPYTGGPDPAAGLLHRSALYDLASDLPLIFAASIQGRVALGPEAGSRIARLGRPVVEGAGGAVVMKELCAELDGFTLHAAVRVPDGRTHTVRLPREEWTALHLDAHPGYISWSDYERNQKQIEKTAKAFGRDRRHGPPREGPALLQGLVICGVCGIRMSVRYRQRHGKLLPTYTCHVRTIAHREPTCQILHGEAIDAAVGDLLVDLMKPMALELSLAVQDEIGERLDEADRLRRMQVESAQYEVDLARNRYMQVDPSRRLVADSLEASWNEKLRALESAQEEYERGRATDRARLDEKQRERILELTNDFPALWNDPSTSHRERKRMTALIIEDVTLTRRDDKIIAGIRFRGGRTQTVEVPAPIRECDRCRTPPDIVAQIDSLLDEEHTDGEIAAILNGRGLKTGAGDSFSTTSVQWVRYTQRLESVWKRLRHKGMLSCSEIARQLGVDRTTVMRRFNKGELRARRTHDKGRWVFWPLDQQPGGASHGGADGTTTENHNSTAEGAV